MNRAIKDERRPKAPFQAAADNVQAWYEEIERLAELSALQGELLARRVSHTDTAGGESAFLKNSLPYLFKTQATPTLHGAQTASRLAFCRAWLQKFPRTDAATTRAVAAEEQAPVACLDSPLFLGAHQYFKEILPLATHHPAATFTEVIDEVAAGAAAFGILPIENAENGKLFRFYEQIERHELHIYATKSVTLGDGEEQTRLALVSKTPPVLPKQAEKVLECVVFEEDEFSVADVLFVAASCGIALRRIDSLPASFGKGHFLHHPIFCTKDGDLDLFCTYLDLFMPRTIITAHYINLKG